MKCLICNLDMIIWEDFDADMGLVLEYSEFCPTGHYYYEYHHGYIDVKVGDKFYYWNHYTSFSEVEKIIKIISDDIEKEKQNA